MAEAIGIVGSAIAIAGLLYNSCITIHDVILSYQNAPREYKAIDEDLQALQKTLTSLQSTLKGKDGSLLSSDQQDTLQLLEVLLKTCNERCKEFHEKLYRWTSHSTQDKVSKWDKLRLHGHQSEIKPFRGSLNSSKDTILIALGMLNLQATTQNTIAIEEFQDSTAVKLGEFIGKVECLELAMGSLSIAEAISTQENVTMTITHEDVSMVKRTLEEHGQLLKQCINFCNGALSTAQALPGVRVRYADAMEHSRQIIGNIGPITADAPSVMVERASARGNAVQATGNINFTGMSPEMISAFFNNK